MKKIIGILTALIMSFTLSSCATTAQAQIDDMYDNVDINVVVSYGTPYYNTEGLLLYYIYRDMFYYPYYYNNRYYLHRYSRPLPPPIVRERYKPVPKIAFNGRHRPIVRHDNHSPRPNIEVRPNGNQPTPNIKMPTQRTNNNGGIRPNTSHSRQTPNMNRNGNRPSIPQRSSTRTTTNGSRGHFGN